AGRGSCEGRQQAQRCVRPTRAKSGRSPGARLGAPPKASPEEVDDERKRWPAMPCSFRYVDRSAWSGTYYFAERQASPMARIESGFGSRSFRNTARSAGRRTVPDVARMAPPRESPGLRWAEVCSPRASTAPSRLTCFRALRAAGRARRAGRDSYGANSESRIDAAFEGWCQGDLAMDETSTRL
ncbi:MAG: hypothetical protein RL033_7011, partial [Pseudomonadota bacterium]